MIKVLERFLIKGKTVLVCELFDDDIITNKILINGNVIGNEKFSCGKPLNCFSNPKTRDVVIDELIPKETNIKEILFV